SISARREDDVESWACICLQVEALLYENGSSRNIQLKLCYRERPQRGEMSIVFYCKGNKQPAPALSSRMTDF
ncbi:unnamed protein product, partial [Amoebophrya sp. A120]